MGKSSQMEKVKKTGSVQECLAELLHELNPLYRHVFNSEWQRSQLQALKANLPEGWATATCDFAENFLSKFQNEPQSAHWSYKQVTVYPVVVHFRCPEAGCQQLRRDCLVILSDDLNHDYHASQVFVQHVVAYLPTVRHFEKVVLVSDGCSAQFKLRLPFLYLSHTQVSGCCDMEVKKVFFGARHGKNDSDWCGGAVKRAATRDVAAGIVTVRTASKMYEHCRKNLSVYDKGGCQHKVQQFLWKSRRSLKGWQLVCWAWCLGAENSII